MGLSVPAVHVRELKRCADALCRTVPADGILDEYGQRRTITKHWEIHARRDLEGAQFVSHFLPARERSRCDSDGFDTRHVNEVKRFLMGELVRCHDRSLVVLSKGSVRFIPSSSASYFRLSTLRLVKCRSEASGIRLEKSHAS